MSARRSRADRGRSCARIGKAPAKVIVGRARRESSHARVPGACRDAVRDSVGQTLILAVAAGGSRLPAAADSAALRRYIRLIQTSGNRHGAVRDGEHSYCRVGRARRVGQDDPCRSAAARRRARSGRRAASSAARPSATSTRWKRRYQHSLSASLLHLDCRGHAHPSDRHARLPGFHRPVRSARCDAVETAAVVINAQTGIEMITTRMMEWAADAQALPHDHRQQDRRARTSTCRRARVAIQDDVRQGVPADQPARGRRQARRRLLLQPGGRGRLLVGR